MIKFIVPVPVFVPGFLVRFCVWLLLLYRKNHYGYPFRRIKLTQGKYAIVDVEDYDKLNVYNWFATYSISTFYALRNENGKSIKMHRKIMNFPQGYYIDHINHNGLDNRKANLRIVTPAQNSRNRRKGRRKTSSKYKGVYFMKGIKKWRADIYYNDKSIYLGYFDNETDAARAYDAAAKIYHGEFAALNFS